MKNSSVFKKQIMLFLISMSIFLSVLDLFIVNVALPRMRVALGASVAEMQFVIVYYVLGYGAFLITSSKVGIKYGHKRVFVISMFSFAIFSLLCGISSSVMELNSYRLLQGISGAFMIPQGVTLLASIFNVEKERQRAYAIYGAIAGMSSVLGQILGGLLPDLDYSFGAWRLIFLINVPIALLVAFASIFVLVEIEQKRELKIQPFSQFLLITLLVVLMYSLITGAEHGWTIWLGLAFMGSIMGLVVFVGNQVRNYRKNTPTLLDFSPFKYQTFTIALIALIFYSLVQDSYFFIYASHFQLKLHFSATQTGLLFAFQAIGYVLASFFSLRYLTLYKEKFMLFGLGLMLIGLALHYWLLTGEIAFYKVSVLLFEYGFGCGIILPSMFTYAMSKLPTEHTSAASGLYLTVQQLSIALGVSIVGQSYFGSANGHFNSTVLMIVLLILTALVFICAYKKSSY